MHLVVSRCLTRTRARYNRWNLVFKDDGSLDSTLVLHRLQAFAPLFKLEGLIDNSFDAHFSTVLNSWKVSDCLAGG